MCELMTIAAALVFTAIYFVGRSHGRKSPAVFTTMLMFWGAALMWSVDCVHSAMEEGLSGLLDLSFEDMQLGFIIIAFGLALFGVLLFVERLSLERRRTLAAA